MNSWLTPVVFFCAFTSGENHKCDGQTALYKHEIHSVSNPMSCLMEGYVDAAQTIMEWREEHPNSELEFRVLCKRSDQKT